MSKYYRIEIGDIFKDENGEIIVKFLVRDTKNGKVVMQGERVLEVDFEMEKENIYLEVWELLTHLHDDNEKSN
jgi:hypothetical protein